MDQKTKSNHQIPNSKKKIPPIMLTWKAHKFSTSPKSPKWRCEKAAPCYFRHPRSSWEEPVAANMMMSKEFFIHGGKTKGNGRETVKVWWCRRKDNAWGMASGLLFWQTLPDILTTVDLGHNSWADHWVGDCGCLGAHGWVKPARDSFRPCFKGSLIIKINT